MSVTSLTKTSLRSKRTACVCGNPGPFYEAVDQDGRTHLVMRNSLTKATPQGGDIPVSYLHTCSGYVPGNGEPVPVPGTGEPGEPGEPVPGEPGNNVAQQAQQAAAAAQAKNNADPKLAALLAMLEDLFARPSLDEDAIRKIVAELMDDYVYPERTIVLTPHETREVSGTTHKQFGDVLAAIASGANVQLVGAPGVGKTHLCKQVAEEALGLGFYAINFHLQSTASELKGYMDATGNYVPTVVFDWATNPDGGVLLCDELDRAHAGILAALNSILSNRFITLPNRETVYLTDKHVVLAATNTWGDGPTWEYPAAQKFSAEFKDRFIAMELEIDEAVELAAAMGKGAPVDVTKRAVSYVQRVRANVKREAINGVVISPRASQNMAALLAREVDWDKAVAWTMRKGMDADTWAKVA